mgnify:CR=1 FL=1
MIVGLASDKLARNDDAAAPFGHGMAGVREEVNEDLHELLRAWENYHRIITAEAHMKHIQFREESRYPGFYYRTDKNFVGVWSINDSGDVPPRWKIDGKLSNGMQKPHGIALDPKHKEVVVADMRLNAILTFYFPEIF